MVLQNDKLLISLRENFALATQGGDRMRTASFLNANMQALGVGEWMEAYSLNGTEWALKRMVLHPAYDSPGVIHQHTQPDYRAINFGEALYRLAEYEAGQAALGFIPDAEDRGQMTGAPLFRAVAQAEGIPHDVDGRLVVPQMGHIVEDGVYPADAFVTAASSVSRKKNAIAVAHNAAISPDGAGLICAVGQGGFYTLELEMKSDLKHYHHQVNSTLTMLKTTDLNTLLGNSTLFGYGPHYKRLFSNGEYLADRPVASLRTLDNTKSKLPRPLLTYIRYQFVLANMLSHRVLLSAMTRVIDSGAKVHSKALPMLEQAIQSCGASAGEFAPLLTESASLKRDVLRNLGHQAEFHKIGQVLAFVEDLMSSTSINLSALPDLGLNIRYQIEAPARMNAFNRGPD